MRRDLLNGLVFSRRVRCSASSSSSSRTATMKQGSAFVLLSENTCAAVVGYIYIGPCNHEVEERWHRSMWQTGVRQTTPSLLARTASAVARLFRMQQASSLAAARCTCMNIHRDVGISVIVFLSLALCV